MYDYQIYTHVRITGLNNCAELSTNIYVNCNTKNTIYQVDWKGLAWFFRRSILVRFLGISITVSKTMLTTTLINKHKPIYDQYAVDFQKGYLMRLRSKNMN